MPLLRLIGFARLTCGCLLARYQESRAGRDVRYVENKGAGCAYADHRPNQLIPTDISAASTSSGAASHST